MNKLLSLVVFFLCLAPGPSVAASFYSADGDRYSAAYNKHGAVLTSEHEKYFPKNAAGTDMEKTKLLLYLGVQCDAYSENYGNGKWGQSPGGFVIRFDHKAFGFIRQEIAVPHEGKCTLSGD
ncbi:MAG: hypothetical protein RI601_07035 [Desulfurivibrionaceae bacterium]|nr:hypothetical protein [Desulfurivibrionaceae bacterium]